MIRRVDRSGGPFIGSHDVGMMTEQDCRKDRGLKAARSVVIVREAVGVVG